MAGQHCLAMGALLALSACAYQPQHALPGTAVPADLAQFSHTRGTINWQDQPLSDWWQRFGSDELNQLYTELQTSSLDLQTAQVLLNQSRTLVRQQRADNWPSVSFSASNRHLRDFDSGVGVRTDGAGFNAAYEVDLWGSRSAATYSAAVLQAGQQHQYRSTQLQLQAQLAENYITHLALRERVDIARQNLAASEQLLQLMDIRFNAGSASRIELDQQRNVYLNAQAQLQTLQRSLTSSERALALLLGRESLAVPVAARLDDLTMPTVSAVQPAALLEYRPDVAFAETRIRYEQATLYQQRQKRWPRLTLSADTSVADLSELSTGWSGALVQGLTTPIFNAGLIGQQIAFAEENVNLALLDYRQSVLRAMEDALETLTDLRHHHQLAQIREQELENSERLHQVALLRYEAGDTDFLNLLAAQSTWFSARDAFIQSQSNRLIAAVNVFRAMGVAPADAAPVPQLEQTSD